MNLSELVIRAQVGDEDAYQAIYQRFREMALAYAFSILGDQDLAEDARQEAFISAYCDLQALRVPAAFPGWFRQIVRKQSIEIQRKRRAMLVPLDRLPEIATGQKRQDQVLDERQRMQQVVRVIDHLPLREREVTRQYYLEDLTLRDIARRNGVPAKTVKSRLHQARARLRQRLIERVKMDVKKRYLSGDKSPRESATLEAIALFDKDLARLLKFPSREEQERAGQLVCAKGRLQRFMGQHIQALETFEQGLTIPALKGDPLFRARLRAEMGLTLIQTAQYSQAQHQLNQSRAMTAARREGGPLMAVILNGLGLCAWGRGDWRKGRDYYTQSLQASRANGLMEMEAQALNNLALLDWKQGLLDEALAHYKACLRLWKKIGNRFGQALAMMNLAIIEENMGRLMPADRRYRESLTLGEELGFTQLQAACHTNLGNLALVRGRNDQALESNWRAVEIARAIGDRRSEAIALENIALAQGGLGRALEAERALGEARTIARAIGDRERLLSLELTTVECGLRLGGEADQTERLAQAGQLLEQGGYEAERPRLLRLRLEALVKGGQLEQTPQLLKEALEVCRRQKNRNEEKRIRKLTKPLITG